MPSPIGHSLAGLVIATLERGRKDAAGARPAPSRWRTVLWTGGLIVAANGPDVDFLPGILLGSPDLFHRGNLHSFGAAALIGTIVYLVGRLVRKASAVRAGSFVGLAYGSHVLLDLFSTGSRQWGVPLFWPFSEHYFVLPIALFFPLRREDTLERFLPSVFQPHNVYAVLWEVFVVGTVLLATRLVLDGSGTQGGRADRFEAEAQNKAR